MDSNEAREALAQLDITRARMAESIGHCPPWRHAAFGALFSALMLGTAISREAQVMASGLIVVSVVLLMRSDRKRMGVWVNGYRRGRTLPTTLALVLLMAAGVFIAMKLRLGGYGLAPKLALAAAAFAVATGFSVLWQGVYQRELRKGAR